MSYEQGKDASSMTKKGGSVKAEVESAARKVAEPLVSGLGYELVDVEYAKQDGELCLTVYIDRTDGANVTLDDCETVSRTIDGPIDGIACMTESYNLEVSSPGLDRPLASDRDFEKYKGQLVDVKLYEAADGVKMHSGILGGLADGDIILHDKKGAEHRFPRAKVAQVKRTIEF
jgi:ribosome maturation factor RimP